MNPQDALIIFAKTPDINSVKTRLKPYLSDNERLSLHKALLENTMKVAINLKNIKVTIFYTPEGGEDYFKRFKLPVFLQKGKDLGERMYNAMKQMISRGNKKVVVIGSDIPDISNKIILEAFNRLNTSDTVIGPAEDGGYYLIGMKKPDKKIFSGIDWSTKKVLNQTLKKAKYIKLKVSLVQTLRDIDRPEDLDLLKHKYLIESKI